MESVNEAVSFVSQVREGVDISLICNHSMSLYRGGGADGVSQRGGLVCEPGEGGSRHHT